MEFVACSELSRDNGLCSGVHDLLINGCARFEVHRKRNHALYYIRWYSYGNEKYKGDKHFSDQFRNGFLQ